MIEGLDSVFETSSWVPEELLLDQMSTVEITCGDR